MNYLERGNEDVTKKKKEGDISVTINFGNLDGEIYVYLNKLPSRTIRTWEIKKLAITQFETKAPSTLNQVPKRTSELDSITEDKLASKIQDFD